MSAIKTIFFDVNETLLNLEKLNDAITQYLNNKKELAELWFSKMLHYSLVLNETKQFYTFDKIGLAVLEMICNSHKINFNKTEAQQVLALIKKLPAHPDVNIGLEKLRKKGFTLKALTNGAQDALKAQISYAQLNNNFDELISIEKFKLYKPNINVYKQVKPDNIIPQECLLVAAHAWDITGAKAAGWRTAFVKREGKSIFPLVEKPDYLINTIEELADLL